MRKPLLFVCLALASLPLQAATWRLLLVHSDSGIFFFDAASVVKKDGRVTVLIEQIRDPAQMDLGGVATIAVRDVFDCTAHTLRPLEARTYAQDGALLASDARDKPPFEPAADTAGADFVRIACLPDFPALAHPDLYSAIAQDDAAAYAASRFAAARSAPPAAPATTAPSAPPK